MFFFFVALISARTCHNLLFYLTLACARLSWHHRQTANACFFGSRSQVPYTLFSALEHRFLQVLHLYRAAVFHKKIATQRKVVWRKDVYNRKNPQQFFNNIYTTNLHPLSNKDEQKPSKQKPSSRQRHRLLASDAESRIRLLLS